MPHSSVSVSVLILWHMCQSDVKRVLRSHLHWLFSSMQVHAAIAVISKYNNYRIRAIARHKHWCVRVWRQCGCSCNKNFVVLVIDDICEEEVVFTGL